MESGVPLSVTPDWIIVDVLEGKTENINLFSVSVYSVHGQGGSGAYSENPGLEVGIHPLYRMPSYGCGIWLSYCAHTHSHLREIYLRQTTRYKENMQKEAQGQDQT